MSGGPVSICPRHRGIWLSAALLVGMVAAAPTGPRAQEATGFMELTAGRNEAETETASGQRTDFSTDFFVQRYNFDFVWRLYPNLQVLAGGLFERTDANLSDGIVDTDSTTERLRPYLDARLRTPLYSAQFSFFRTEDDLETGGISSSRIQELFSSTLGWRPADLPTVRLRFFRTNNYDGARRIQNTTDDSAELVSDYQPIPNLQMYYRSEIGRFEDMLEGSEVRRWSHIGRVNYSDSWWDQRMRLGAEYNVNYRKTEVTAPGGGEVVTPLFPIDGLSALTDIPTDVTLSANTALIDADRIASAGINLGLPPPGGDERPRNLGLDFGGPTTVNTFLLWVDRDLPPEISDTYSWDIYTSSDNLNWILRESASPAVFGPFATRFEIRFTDLTARYVKAVTRPLAPTVPGADQFPDILVTELNGTLRTPASEAVGESSRTNQTFNANLRTRILENPNLNYELSYFVRDPGTSPSTQSLVNGLSLQHAFSPEYSTLARVAREDSRRAGEDRTTYNYSASLQALPLPTLQNTLVFSGQSTDVDGKTSDSTSVFLYTSAELYRGVSANLSLGTSTSEDSTGKKTDTTQVDAIATLVPHQSTTLNLLYQSRTTDSRDGGLPVEISRTTHSSQASITFRPVNTLYLFFSYRMEEETGAKDRFLRNYSISWTPFPGGSLQIAIRFDERFRSEIDSLSRVFSPRLRWNITDRWYFDINYEKIDTDSILNETRAENWSGNMRILF